ncbi:MAG: NAD(P)H-hydrate dehydratase [Clostridia bacterium]|nr:NAD(P)H-hydrate dehydratase [Clostridia bacterium]
MKYVLTNAQMREADKFTIEHLGVPALELMERAGNALFEAAVSLAPTGKILCVMGGGNNGGDGFVCGRLLLLSGREVDGVLIAKKRSHECELNLSEFVMNGGKLHEEIPENDYALVVDCLFGTGYTPREDERVETAIRRINALKKRGAKILSADIPSGVCGDNGCAYYGAVDADVTLCIGEIKAGAVLGDGLDHSGDILRADIGIMLPDFDCEGNGYAHLLEDSEIGALLPRRKRNTHKGSYGRASVIAGSLQYTGAAYLSTAAALRSGAGYTALYAPKGVLPYFMLKVPEALLVPLCEGEQMRFDEEVLSSVPQGAAAYGMGLGVSEEVARGAEYLMENHQGTLVLDADALNSLAEYRAEELETIFQKKGCEVVITPHPREFARLTKREVKEVLENGISLAKEFAARHGVTVLLKGASTIVTDGVRTAISATGTAGQAKGGSGDVLSGVIAGLCASALQGFDGACAGAYLCGRAAELATREIGEYSLAATDVIAYLGRAFLSVTEHAHERGGKH